MSELVEGKYKPFSERPSCKIGVTNSTHERLRELKIKGDNFNDVIERLINHYEDTTIDESDIDL